MSLKRSEFVGSDEYFSILSRYGQLFRDMLAKDDEDYFDDNDSDDEIFCSIYDSDVEEDIQEEEEIAEEEEEEEEDVPVYDIDGGRVFF